MIIPSYRPQQVMSARTRGLGEQLSTIRRVALRRRRQRSFTQRLLAVQRLWPVMNEFVLSGMVLSTATRLLMMCPLAGIGKRQLLAYCPKCHDQ